MSGHKLGVGLSFRTANMEVQICPVNHQRSPFPQLPGSAADCRGDKNTTFIWKTAVSQAALQLEAGL